MNSESGRLLADYVAGKNDAATEIFDQYVGRLVALAASRLSDKLKGRVEPEDIVQSALRSFFRKADLDEVSHRRNGDLWRLLAAITINKVLQRAEFEHAGKRDPNREQGGRTLIEQLAQEPTHEDAVDLIDEIETFVGSLSEVDRRIVNTRLDGKSVPAISKQIGVSEAKIRLRLESIEERLKRRLKDN